MPMIIYQPLQANQQQFIEFWSFRYVYAEENLYLNNVGQELTEQGVLELFQWKNGTPLSARKLASVHRNFVQRREELAQLQANVSANDFLAHFTNGGAIWRIFWLHCWQPNRFPIYDQHVHRAMAFICNGVPEEIPQYDPRKIEAYIDRYLPFHAQFAAFDGRAVDKALWAFGKFIKEVNFPVVVLNENR
jgi:hypothetical protein